MILGPRGGCTSWTLEADITATLRVASGFSPACHLPFSPTAVSTCCFLPQGATRMIGKPGAENGLGSGGGDRARCVVRPGHLMPSCRDRHPSAHTESPGSAHHVHLNPGDFRGNSLSRADTSPWSLGGSCQGSSWQGLPLGQCALCWDPQAMALEGELAGEPLSRWEEGDFVAWEPGLRSSSQGLSHSQAQRCSDTPSQCVGPGHCDLSCSAPREAVILPSPWPVTCTGQWPGHGGPLCGGWEVEHSGRLHHVGQEGRTEEKSGKRETLLGHVGPLRSQCMEMWGCGVQRAPCESWLFFLSLFF